MNPIKLSFNKTTTFLLPILFPNNTHDEIFSNYFKQAYIGLLDDDEFTPKIVLEFPEDIEESTLVQFSMDFGDGVETKITDNLIYYDVQEHMETDYYYIVNGNYSKISERSKGDILDFWDEDEDSLLHAILYNKKDKIQDFKPFLDRDMIHELDDLSDECWPPPNIISDELLVT